MRIGKGHAGNVRHEIHASGANGLDVTRVLSAELQVGRDRRRRRRKIFGLVQNVVMSRAIQQPYSADRYASCVVYRIKAVHVDLAAFRAIKVKDFERNASRREKDVLERAEADIVDLSIHRHNSVIAEVLDRLVHQPGCIVSLTGLHPRCSECLKDVSIVSALGAPQTYPQVGDDIILLHVIVEGLVQDLISAASVKRVPHHPQDVESLIGEVFDEQRVDTCSADDIDHGPQTGLLLEELVAVAISDKGLEVTEADRCDRSVNSVTVEQCRLTSPSTLPIASDRAVVGVLLRKCLVSISIDHDKVAKSPTAVFCWYTGSAEAYSFVIFVLEIRSPTKGPCSRQWSARLPYELSSFPSQRTVTSGSHSVLAFCNSASSSEFCSCDITACCCCCCCRVTARVRTER